METSKKLKQLIKDYVPNLVSVIIPTYNRETYLIYAIKSVVEQTYRPIECIIVDDGSNDNTRAVVNKIAANQDTSFVIKYFHQSNLGSQIARNEGTKRSKGEFVQFLDSDDLLYPEKIQKQVSFLNDNLECDGVFGDWEKGVPHNIEFIQACETDDMVSQMLTVRPVHTLAFLYRRDIVNKIGEWDVKIKRNQEIDFQVTGLIEGAVYKYQPQNCGLWRIHKEERIANTTGFKEILDFFKKWEKVLGERGLLTERLKKNMANVLFWEAVKETEKRQKGRIVLLLEAIRLDTKISFYNTPKMRLMVRLMGKRLSLKLWLVWFKKHLK